MTEVFLVIVIFMLVLHNFYLVGQIVNLVKAIGKRENVEVNDNVATPNQIEENHYRDISDVSPNEIIK